MSESFARRRLEFQIGAGVAFLAPLILFLRTVAPTTSYWDCGEFIACSYTMGIPHPPGAPMFIMIGRVFSLIPFFDIGYRVNLISVFSSALTVLLLYLIIVRLFREWRGLPETFRENLIVITAALFGALSFAVTDTFWFNAVEAEVYALSTLFTALVLWMALLWMDFASEDHSIRFLVMIGYVFCLSIGLHLLNLLVIPSILLMFWFAKPQIFRGLEVLGVGVLLYLVLPAPVNLLVIPAVGGY